jgi:uncharacterized protein (TIGR03086 family)
LNSRTANWAADHARVVHNGAMTTDPVDVLSRALEQIGALITGVGPDQVSLPTPCQSWDVAALLDHVLADMPRFIDSARGGKPDYSSASPSVGPHWAPEFANRSDELLQTWRDARDPARLETGHAPRQFQDMQIAEMAVHAWDLAAALGLGLELDPELAEYSADWMGSVLVPDYRGSEADGKAFGQLVAVPTDAPAYDRLVAISGRDPKWAPPRS